MRLYESHPEIATRPCDSCRKYFYRDDGTIDTAKDWVDGQEVEVKKLRPDPDGVPCNTDAGCPKGHYSEPTELSENLLECYDHYLECRAVGQFPDDPLVRRSAAIIHQVEKSCERARRLEEITALLGGRRL